MRSPTPRILALLLVAIALFSEGVAGAASKRAVWSEPAWATVNVCNPSQLGVRAQIDGDGSDGELWVRFTAQWFDSAQGAWVPIAGEPLSPWLNAGSARYVSRQGGWTYSLDPRPPGSPAISLRGVAEIQWRHAGTVVRSTTQVTSGGHPEAEEGNPPGTSLATCELPAV
jgi:hypothetical protein